jgi:hypothetical protein
VFNILKHSQIFSGRQWDDIDKGAATSHEGQNVIKLFFFALGELERLAREY